MLNIGNHMSIAKGYANAAKNAISIGANTFQFFTRNPRGGKAKTPDTNDINKLKQIIKENNFAPLLAHAPYTLNMASPDEKIRTFAQKAFREDLDLLKILPCNLYNIHPGSPREDNVKTGINRIANIINASLKENDDVFILLETMAGKGSEIGKTFEELKSIIDKVELKEKIGVCIDTCHIFCAGYDIINKLDEVLDDFNKIIGISKLKALHINGTLNNIASFKDRHAKIGEGYLPDTAIINLINHKSIRNLPMFLETPNELNGYKKEIEFLKANYIYK